MKVAWLSSTAVVVLVTSSWVALAADMNAPAPALIPAYSWTGCYVGGNIGGAFTDDAATNRFGATRSHDSSGFVGGGQVGCDYQFAPRWVLGAEGRGAWTSLKGSNAGNVLYPATGVTVPSQFTVSNDFLASATARLGYSFVDRWLFYVKGGAAFTNEMVDDAFTTPGGATTPRVGVIAVDPSSSATRTGWTAGAGVEWAFTRNWSATLDYDYYDFGSNALTLTDPNSTVDVHSFRDTIHAVTVGVNYRF
jgi:outer membrane immunogenic protein